MLGPLACLELATQRIDLVVDAGPVTLLDDGVRALRRSRAPARRGTGSGLWRLLRPSAVLPGRALPGGATPLVGGSDRARVNGQFQRRRRRQGPLRMLFNEYLFCFQYLGCVEVFESRGMQVCEEALRVLKVSKCERTRAAMSKPVISLQLGRVGYLLPPTRLAYFTTREQNQRLSRPRTRFLSV